ncbi:head-tail connector protein [Paragemmobacter ruber]|uniref:PhiE125 gp8 family phage protein n=1 Tax=Paragemmobacter ruber TaxID=1985673 RepID=A0ABW9Y0D8_9RHOB|nr:hypothetical protein [Rhodobacter ruber]NBE05934.1 hypothetical protein [Rhodobacter ruber]
MKAVGEVPAAVTAAAFKRAVHIIEGVTDDDPLITDLLRAAQDTVEAGTRRPMTPRAVLIEWRATSWARWWFPVAPVVSVASVSLQQGDGSFVALAPEAWRLEMAADEPSLVFADGALVAGRVVRVACSVGYADGAGPHQLRQATILLAKEWMDAGIAVEAGQGVPISFGARALMRQVKYVRPAEFGVA